MEKKTLSEIVRLIKDKEIKSEEVTQSFIKNINNDNKLNSFITICSDEALKNAKNFDKEDNKDEKDENVSEASLDADFSVDEFNFDEQLSDTESDEQSSEQVAQKKNY